MDSIVRAGGQAQFVSCDVTDSTQHSEAFERYDRQPQHTLPLHQFHLVESRSGSWLQLNSTTNRRPTRTSRPYPSTQV